MQVRITFILFLSVSSGCSSPSGKDDPLPVVRGPLGCSKVCQLIGDLDLQTQQPTNNQTWTRSGIYGTDLGASFEHQGKLWFLFGDTVGASMDDAEPLFDESCVGELSVLWNPHLQKWLMTYNCGFPRGILFRTADDPWGPWSKAAVLFDPDADEGYCHFMHVSWENEQCDSVHDPGRENEYGGEYGPYQIARYAKATDEGSMVYFTMSTWNPYNVVLMRTELVRQ